jgi:dTDP-4-amino-4,6-dideoxygalactose transaminase
VIPSKESELSSVAGGDGLETVARQFLPEGNIVFTSYGRTALYLALLTIDVSGKDVILPAFTCASTLTPAILHAGGVPCFVDISKNTLDMSSRDIERFISPNTGAIITHHYYGSVAPNMQEVQECAQKHGISHVEDCAHSLGATKGGVPIGSVGDVAIFSFSKSMNCPGGGAVLFKKDTLYRKAITLQKTFANRFHSRFTDSEVFRYRDALMNDRPGSISGKVRLKGPSPLTLCGRLFRLALRVGRLYRPGDFRIVLPTQRRGRPVGFDTRMTQLQRVFISSALLSLGSAIIERRQKATMLEQIIPSYFSNCEENTFANFVVMHSNVEQLQALFRRVKIRTRRVWPFFQEYWPAQLTESVKLLKDHLVLIDVDCINRQVVDALRCYLTAEDRQMRFPPFR